MKIWFASFIMPQKGWWKYSVQSAKNAMKICAIESTTRLSFLSNLPLTADPSESPKIKAESIWSKLWLEEPSNSDSRRIQTIS